MPGSLRRWSGPIALLLLACIAVSGPASAGEPVAVGSKKFTESVILGELASHGIRQSGRATVHREQMGGTRVLWSALRRGDIDLYPEYTGTLRQEIFADHALPTRQALRAALAELGLAMTAPLGFNNTYAIGMRSVPAERLGIRAISDLAAHPELTLGFSNEFMDREDGWPGLRRAYDLPHEQVRGLDHALAYRALARGTIDATDLYTTDAEIQRYDLRILKDDRGYFPDYEAVFIYRHGLGPDALTQLRRLEGRIDEAAMTAMNARTKLDGVPETRVAAGFLHKTLGLDLQVAGTTAVERLVHRTGEHLALVVVSLSSAIVVAVPAGVLAWLRPRLGQAILAAVGIVQTIPPLALLVFMIPLLGIGGPPAIAALFLYSLLPILRNTYAGLQDIPEHLRESARALGLPLRARLRRIEIPMASRAILAGIKTSAVVNVGTATLGALIGAGGYGQPILTGIRLDDLGLILQGAVPAAALALITQGMFELLERGLVPRGLRLASTPR